MPEPIKTTVSFIAGTVHVALPKSFPASAYSGQVTVNIRVVTEFESADIDKPTASCPAEVNSKGSHYQFAVPPGEWQVWATLGLIESATHTVTVESGKVSQIDFHFSVADTSAG